MAKLLLEGGANPNVQNHWNKTLLSYAAEKGRLTVVELLVKMGADVNLKHGSSRTPLLYAAAKGHEAIVEMLLENDADPNSTDEWSRTPLLYAVGKCHEAVVGPRIIMRLHLVFLTVNMMASTSRNILLYVNSALNVVPRNTSLSFENGLDTHSPKRRQTIERIMDMVEQEIVSAAISNVRMMLLLAVRMIRSTDATCTDGPTPTATLFSCPSQLSA